MKPARRRKLMILVLIISILAIASALVLYALRQNISLFYTPTQIANGEAPANRSIRVGGMVVKGSVIRSASDLLVKFKVTDFKQTVEITYRGILPDLFREGQGIVARGQLGSQQMFKATEILAKHDENYMPPEVKAALASAGKVDK